MWILIVYVILYCYMDMYNVHVAVQVWPKQVTIPFMRGEELEQWQAPLGEALMRVGTV